MKKRKTAITSLLILQLAYLLIEYPLFDLHGMKQWPLILNLAASVVIIISILMSKNTISTFTAFGYIFGFALGYVFDMYGQPYGGNTDNSLWQVWILVFIISVFIGMNIEVKKEKNRKRSLERESNKKDKINKN